jgi:[ribosomal protein S18]-alanine N-acetyltransferase
MIVAWATPEHAPAMASAHAQAFDSPWDEATFLDLLDGEGVFGLVALGEDPMGVVLCRATAGEAEILTVGVPPWARRQGVARALMAGAIEGARSAGARELFLEVAVDNAAAIGLYEALGFETTGLRKGYYDRAADGRLDALVMRLDLPAGRD